MIHHFPALTPLIRRQSDVTTAMVDLTALCTRLTAPLIAALHYTQGPDDLVKITADSRSLPDVMSALRDELQYGVVLDMKRERLECYPHWSDEGERKGVVIVYWNADGTPRALSMVNDLLQLC